MTRSIMTKIYTLAHIVPGLEKKWLQHLRDFDAANAGCHFEVIADQPDATLPEIVEMLRIKPGLSVVQIMERKRRPVSPETEGDIAKSIVWLLPDDKEAGLRVLDAALRMVERFKR
jgi:hypothetical protein